MAEYDAAPPDSVRDDVVLGATAADDFECGAVAGAVVSAAVHAIAARANKPRPGVRAERTPAPRDSVQMFFSTQHHPIEIVTKTMLCQIDSYLDHIFQ